MSDGKPAFELFRLTKDLFGELTSFLTSKEIVRLWTTGDVQMRAFLSSRNVVRALRCIGVRKEGKEWSAKIDVLNRFRFLQLLSISVREHNFSMTLPSVHVNLADFPPTLTSLRLYCDNSISLLVDPKTSSEDKIQYHDIGQLFPTLQILELSGTTAVPAPFLTKINWPETLHTLNVPKASMKHNELASMPPHLTCISLSEVDYSEAQEECKPLGANLEDLNVSCRPSHSTGSDLVLHFDCLPAHLKRLRLSYRGNIPDHSMRALPISLTSLELNLASLDVKLLVPLVHLERLGYDAKYSPPNVSQFLPRSLVRLAMRHYNYVDDEFWMGLPRGLKTLSTLNLGPRGLRFQGGGPPVPADYSGSMTVSCIPHIPPLLESVDLKAITGSLAKEAISHISSSVRRLKVFGLEVDAVPQLPAQLRNLELFHAEFTKEWVSGLPNNLETLRCDFATITDPTALSNFPTTMTELKLVHHRSDQLTCFTKEMAVYLPQTLKKFSLRCSNAIDDSFLEAIKIPGLKQLELRSDLAAFTDKAIELLPPRLTWLDLYGCDAWTFSPDTLRMLPRKLTWCYIHFRSAADVNLRPAHEITPFLPPGLEHHNIPSIEKPPGLFW